ncbi:MAG TPA: glycosyltransferase family 4 protein [Candidatus Saccharimonadales bacterium]|nr:glycosyltransferase family 4 protein [Candidatus Saccharimonadales bacterium]
MSTILWITWKDYGHPEAGGAEVVARELTARLCADGHAVTMLTCGYPGAPAQGQLGGVRVIRVGSSRYLHPFQAFGYYVRHLRGRFDIVIEEVNGAAPYFCVLFEHRARRFLLYHQLGRKNWLYEVPAPFGRLGYHILAPAATRLASLSGVPVITVSASTRAALAKHGFGPSRTHIISEGIQLQPLPSLAAVHKYDRPTCLCLGAMRAMKRTLDQVKAFEIAKQRLPGLQLKIAGSAAGAYGRQVLSYARRSPYAADITYLGHVSAADKLALLRQSHVILQTAVEEGWGLTITEAAAQGTPAVAYDVAGLRDSIRHQQTGLTTAENPASLAEAIVRLLTARNFYEQCRRAAWQWSRHITFQQSYQDFTRIVGLA